MKGFNVIFLVCLTISVYAQPSLSSDRIAGSNMVLSDLSRSEYDKIMGGTIFDVFTIDLKPNDYNTDLKKMMFLDSKVGKDYQARLDRLRERIKNDGIKTIQKQTRGYSSSYCTISNYDVNKKGFIIKLDGGNIEALFPGTENNYKPHINGYIINGLKFALAHRTERPRDTNNFYANRATEFLAEIFIPVPTNIAVGIEGKKNIGVQLHLSVDSFTLQKVSLINVDNNGILAEMTVTVAPATNSSIKLSYKKVPHKVTEREAVAYQGIPNWLTSEYEMFTATSFSVTYKKGNDTDTSDIYYIKEERYFNNFRHLYPSITKLEVVPANYYATAENNFTTAQTPLQKGGYLEYNWEVITYNEMGGYFMVTGLGEWLNHIGYTDLSQFEERSFYQSPLSIKDEIDLSTLSENYTKITVTAGINLTTGTLYMSFRRYFRADIDSNVSSSGYYASVMYF